MIKKRYFWELASPGTSQKSEVPSSLVGTRTVTVSPWPTLMTLSPPSDRIESLKAFSSLRVHMLGAATGGEKEQEK